MTKVNLSEEEYAAKEQKFRDYFDRSGHASRFTCEEWKEITDILVAVREHKQRQYDEAYAQRPLLDRFFQCCEDVGWRGFAVICITAYAWFLVFDYAVSYL